MSKAREWAKRVQALQDNGLRFRIDDGGDVAGVTVTPTQFGLQLNACKLEPGAALALAQWIIDAFGEQP